MAKREADIFTVPSLRELHKTPRRFKKILCEVFIDMQALFSSSEFLLKNIYK